MCLLNAYVAINDENVSKMKTLSTSSLSRLGDMVGDK